MMHVYYMLLLHLLTISSAKSANLQVTLPAIHQIYSPIQPLNLSIDLLANLSASLASLDLTCLFNMPFQSTSAEAISIIQEFLSFSGSSVTQEKVNFKMNVFTVDMAKHKDDLYTQISAPKLSVDDPPIEVFVPNEIFLNVSNEQSKIGIVTYKSSDQFTTDPRTVLKSNVIRVEVLSCKTKDLSSRLIITFPVNISEKISGTQTFSCQFYNEAENKWDDAGSFTNLDNLYSNNTVNCSYDHMTPFAVLLVDMTQIDPQQWRILSYLTYIGCSVSAFFSAVTIFLYIFMKTSNRDSSMGIHMSLCAAVFLLNTSFLFIEWGATWSQNSLCVLIAVLIQYSLLSCFSWMAIEALHLYLLLIKVFNTYIKRYLLKLSLFGWGVPAVLVGGSLCVFGSTPFYGRKELNLLGSNETSRFCWITDTRFLYGMNISYFSLTFLFNTSVLVVVIHQIFNLQCSNKKGRRLPSRKDICTVLSLTLLLGMTWGLIFFTAGYTNYPILYLFCICNSLQGLFLFLWVCGIMKKNRCLEAKTSNMSYPTK